MSAPKLVNYNGTEVTLVQLSKAVGISTPTLYRRYRCGDRDAKLWRPLDCIGGNTGSKSESSLRGEGVTVRAREENAARRDAKLDRQRERAERIARVRVAHAVEFRRPLIDESLLTEAEYVANCDRVKYSGQRSWRVTGASL